MSDYIEKKCPQCGQKLRFPKNVGGIVMVCPSCGNRFHSDFKVGGIGKNVGQQGVLRTLFEMPNTLLKRLSRFFL